MNRILALWCHPRSLSTAFERMMMERKDFFVIHERFLYMYYYKQNPNLILAKTQQRDPSTPIEFESIVKSITDDAKNKRVFFKDMCVHIHNPKGYYATSKLLNLFTNTFLIRHPEPSIMSHLKCNPDMIFEEVGYDYQYQVFRILCELKGTPPPLIDAFDLENDPEGIIRSYCKLVDIPYIPESLMWTESVPKQFKKGEKTWHVDVVKSTGFQRGMEVFDEQIKNNDKFKRYYEWSLPFYEAMKKYRIVPSK
jgi:hypothetical protein